MNPKNFFAELKRRNVYKVAVAYAVVGWLVMQIAATVVPALHLSDAITSAVVLLTILGFPVALILAWAFEMTPEGMKRTENVSRDEFIPQWSGRKFAGLLVGIAVVAAGLLLFQLFRSKSASPTGAAAAPRVPEKSIAVLPFENLSEEKSNAYFADGIQDEILARLSKIADLKVISRTSTQKYKSAPNNLREIAQQLGVTNILEGSVQKSADQVRITVQLINAPNDSHLWAETYDRKLIDVFQVESDVAQKIASSLEAKLTGREKQDINADAGTKVPEAYDAYLHALALVNRQGLEALEKLIAFCRRAVELDPSYAQAWARLAIAESQKYFSPVHSPEDLARARTAAETALRLAPELPDAHAAMGSFYYYCLSDYDRALSELSVAREREPNNANVLLSIALVQRRQGKLDASIELQQQAGKLDPLNEDIWANLGRSFRAIRNFDEAREIFDRALMIMPGDPEIIAQKAETYLAQGDLDTAWAMIKDLKFPPTSYGFGTYFTLLVYQHRYDEVIGSVSSLLAKEKEVPPAFVAIGHAALGGLYRLKGDGAKAQSFLLQSKQELNEMRAKGVPVGGDLLQVEARLGRRDEVQQLADALLRKMEKDKWEFPGAEVAVAKAYSILGDFDRALPLLKHALTAPYVVALTPAYLRYDPEWDPVRNDPRFQKLANAKP